jgi:hypothetical protein
LAVIRSEARAQVRDFSMGAGIYGERAMQARGMVFWQCNVVLGQVARQLAQERGFTYMKP